MLTKLIKVKLEKINEKHWALKDRPSINLLRIPETYIFKSTM
jgi:hypothetical protein